MAKKVLMFAGSARKESVNKKLIFVAAEIARSRGSEVTIIDLKDYPLPMYDGDFEEESGQPENAKRLHQLIEEHDYLVMASPEYNGLPSPLLKNVIDWVSRAEGNVYGSKIAAIMSASPGGFGGLRGLTHLRELLTYVGVLTIPEQVAIGGAFGAFAEDGSLRDENQQAMLGDVISALLAVSK